MISIKTESLFKSYKQVQAISDISFEVQKGELFGFIGPDGSGKTTLFRILTSLLLPDNGSVTIENLDIVKDYRKIRNILGYMPGKFSLYQDLTVEENLQFFATIFGTTIKENYYLIKDIYSHLEPFKNRLAGKLSGGMKQKLALSCAMIHKPEVLILDEPTTGVDAVSRKEFWEMLKNLKNNNITIVVSTPYMDEASICDKVSLIQSGKILQIDKPEKIISDFEKPLFSIRSTNLYHLLLALRKYEYTDSAYIFGQYIHYCDKRNEFNAETLIHYLANQNVEDYQMSTINPGIEDCFMRLMTKN